MRYLFTLFLVFIGLAGFAGSTAFAQNAAATDPSFNEVTKSIFDAVMHGQWWAAAAYGVILAMIGARKFMPESWKEGAKGDIIGTAMVFVIAVAGAVGTAALAPGATMTAAVFLTALKIGVAAIGGFTVVHKVVGWLAEWKLLPAWAVPLLKLIALTVGSKAVAKAQAAGDKAVKEAPPTGMAGDDKIVEVE
jgi:hypothetical protein